MFRLKALKTLLKEKAEPQVEFLDRHPVIREMTDYNEYVLAAAEALDTAFNNDESKRRSTHE